MLSVVLKWNAAKGLPVFGGVGGIQPQPRLKQGEGLVVVSGKGVTEARASLEVAIGQDFREGSMDWAAWRRVEVSNEELGL